VTGRSARPYPCVLTCGHRRAEVTPLVYAGQVVRGLALVHVRRRAGTSPTTPPRSAPSPHRQTVAGSTSNASPQPWDATRSRTS
jgi:hypothetical protein